jgi:glycosyltransferase involved in cell wall biosynthesis
LLRDDQRRFRLGRNGRALVERSYSLSAMGRRYLDFYRNLLKRNEA